MPDTAEHIQQAIQQAIEQQPDLILVLSGSSAGSKEYTASIIREMGELLVHGVAVRPGHPVIIGMIANIPIIGVPGYPVSAALTGEIFIQLVLLLEREFPIFLLTTNSLTMMLLLLLIITGLNKWTSTVHFHTAIRLF